MIRYRDGPMESYGMITIFLIGAAVVALSYTLDHVWAATIPYRRIYYFIRAPGVILHEGAHMIGCLITGARIKNVVLFSKEGGSVTYARPLLPYLGDVIISTSPLFVIPLVLSGITDLFSTYLGCTFPVFPQQIVSPEALPELGRAILATFRENLVIRFNGWFLLYLYLTISLILSVSPSRQDMKNAAAGIILLLLAALMILISGIPVAVGFLATCVHLLGIGFTLGLVYGIIALLVSIPLIFVYAYRMHR